MGFLIVIAPKCFEIKCFRPFENVANRGIFSIQLYLPEEKFEAPEGWQFVGNWEVHSELRYVEGRFF